MIAVIFEVEPADGQRDDYLAIAADLRPLFDKVDRFVSIERFQYLADPERTLSPSFWRDEPAIMRWRMFEKHLLAQGAGRSRVSRTTGCAWRTSFATTA